MINQAKMENDKQPFECDVLVIGGGPAGSTAATLLAEKGFNVTLLEKARHPRFHIGESLLPANLPLFERLGVGEAIKAIGMEKRGAEFVSPWHENRQTFEFADAWDKSMPYAYQVRRSEFDEILIRNAARKGAQVIEDCRVVEVEFLPDHSGALVEGQHGDRSRQFWQTRFVIDASGRDTFFGNRLKAKKRNPKHNSAALYGHFSNAQRLSGTQEGHITIFWFEHGWFWFIPLPKGITSIGAVTWPYYMKTRAKRTPEEFLLDTVKLCPALAERLQNAELVSPVEATGNFSYVCDHTHGTNYLLLGDAYTFIDPVFSSGVMLAMNSAFAGAEAVAKCLTCPDESPVALKQFDKVMKRGPKEFSWFIYRVTNPSMRDLFMAPKNLFRAKEALLSVLAGDIFGKTPIWPSVWAFKGMYQLHSLLNLRRSIQSFQKRRMNISEVGEDAFKSTP